MQVSRECLSNNQVQLTTPLTTPAGRPSYRSKTQKRHLLRQHLHRMDIVRRQGFWDQELRKLRECPAHLVGFIMRRAVCDASVALRVSFV